MDGLELKAPSLGLSHQQLQRASILVWEFQSYRRGTKRLLFQATEVAQVSVAKVLVSKLRVGELIQRQGSSPPMQFFQIIGLSN